MDEIRNILLQNIDSFNNSNESIYMKLQDNNLIEQEYIDFGIDYRLNDVRYKDSVLLFYYIDKHTNDILAALNIVAFNRKQFADICFWNFKPEEKLLKKVSLDDFKGYTGDYAITLGFAKSSERLRKNYKIKYLSTISYIQIINDIQSKTNTLIFAETTGIEILKADKVISSSVIYEGENTFNSQSLGVTRKESRPADKMARVLNFRKADNVYNLWTLGKVYFSKDLYLD